MRVMMLQKKSTRVRKEEIVRAAFEVIGKRGGRALTMAAIAEAAGMSEANIYRHFGGKNELFFALTDYIGSAVMGKAATIAAGSRTPLKKLETVFFSHIDLVAHNPGIPRFLYSDDVQLGDPKLAQSMAFRIGNYAETVSGIVAAGIAEKELREDLSPRETALTFLGMIQFTALRWTIGSASFDLRMEAEKLWENFLRLIR